MESIFEPNTIKADLIMEVDRAVAEKRWADEIEEQTIRKRLKEYNEAKGELPIAIIIEADTGASGSQDKPRKSRKERAKDKQQEAKPDTGASDSIEMHKRATSSKPTVPKRRETKEKGELRATI